MVKPLWVIVGAVVVILTASLLSSSEMSESFQSLQFSINEFACGVVANNILDLESAIEKKWNERKLKGK